ncbi:Amidohydrolase [Pleurostoma richardsiae]|uniref:Amidohydrolase n=1 Tax=Pleurostoma richardsiae TaxID=41990 RepID=A0AA38RAY5_9PEZI|nr:Amidohydrolase [Pleurostoma richardsiae]
MCVGHHFVFRNGRFFQARAPVGRRLEATFAEALVAKDGVITFVGPESAAAVREATAAGAKVRDLGGRVAMPGFIDAHVHLMALGLALNKLGLEHCTGLRDIRAVISEYAAANPHLPRIFCRGWMHSMTPEGAKASLIDDLDSRPILITSKDLHSTWCNSAALAELDLDDEPDPPGGTIERDPVTGKPSGVISEAANMKFMGPYMARISTMADRIAALRVAIDEYNRCGYTGLIDMTMEPNSWAAISELRRQEKAAGRRIPMRIAAYWLILPKDDTQEEIKQVEQAAQLAEQCRQDGDVDCRIVGIKLVCDGIVDGLTASLKEPYSHNMHRTDPVWPPEKLAPVVAAATKHGLQIALHAIGDRTIAGAVGVIEQLPACAPLRPRIEHLELTAEEDAKRLGKLGITASVHPVHADPAILKAWPLLIGPKRCLRAFAYREFVDGGAPLAVGSDAPSAPHQLAHNLYVATTRRSAREPALETVVNGHFALTLWETIVGMTQGGARTIFAEHRIGSLEVGKRADLVVMDAGWDLEKLLETTKVAETWFDGQQVYCAAAESPAALTAHYPMRFI